VSTSTNGILAYGIDLGEDVDWEELGYDWDVDKDEFVSKRLAAEGIKGVGLTRHCSFSYPLWLLTSRSIVVHRGDVHTLDKAFLNVPTLETLAIGEAARVLGLATDVTPQWLLVSFWGR
jgi:hypothetical protein